MALNSRRFALVIGNGHYESLPTLSRPAADVKEMCKDLKYRAFSIFNGGPCEDLDALGMEQAIHDFVSAFHARQASTDAGPEVLLLYFSGHGQYHEALQQPQAFAVDDVAVNIHHLLIPALESEAQQSQHEHAFIVLFDACLSEPLNHAPATSSDQACSKQARASLEAQLERWIQSSEAELAASVHVSAVEEGRDAEQGSAANGNLVICAYACMPTQKALSPAGMKCSVWTEALLNGMARVRPPDVLRVLLHAADNFNVKQIGQVPLITYHSHGKLRNVTLDRPRGMTTAAQHADTSGETPESESQKRDYSTVWQEDLEVNKREKPGPGADSETVREFVNFQLDSIARKRLIGQDPVVGGWYRFLPDPASRIQGGQSVVQMVEHTITHEVFAIKFFLFQEAFNRAARLFRECGAGGSEDLAGRLPRVQELLRDVVDNQKPADEWKDRFFEMLPSCIILQKGIRTLAATPVAYVSDNLESIIASVCESIIELHAARVVHRDIKPSNIIQLHSGNWALVDYGLAVREGELTSPCDGMLRFTAPELVAAQRAGEERAAASTAHDAWALGVMIWELACNGSKAWPEEEQDAQQVLDCIEGTPGHCLPWETVNPSEELEIDPELPAPIWRLLSRDPAKRDAVKAFAAQLGRRPRMLHVQRASQRVQPSFDPQAFQDMYEEMERQWRGRDPPPVPDVPSPFSENDPPPPMQPPPSSVQLPRWDDSILEEAMYGRTRIPVPAHLAHLVQDAAPPPQE